MMFRILVGAAIAAVCIVANGSERPVPSGTGTPAPGMGTKDGGAKGQKSGTGTTAPGMGTNDGGAKRQMPAPNANQGAGSKKVRGSRRSGSMANRSRMDRQDRVLLDAIENADSIVALSRLITSAMGSRNSEVRQAMVDALADKGRKGVNELAYFIVDPDDEVAESAFSAWASILEAHGTSGRAAAIISAARIIQQNSSHGGMQAPHGMSPSKR